MAATSRLGVTTLWCPTSARRHIPGVRPARVPGRSPRGWRWRRSQAHLAHRAGSRGRALRSDRRGRTRRRMRSLTPATSVGALDRERPRRRRAGNGVDGETLPAAPHEPGMGTLERGATESEAKRRARRADELACNRTPPRPRERRARARQAASRFLIITQEECDGKFRSADLAGAGSPRRPREPVMSSLGMLREAASTRWRRSR